MVVQLIPDTVTVIIVVVQLMPDTVTVIIVVVQLMPDTVTLCDNSGCTVFP